MTRGRARPRRAVLAAGAMAALLLSAACDEGGTVGLRTPATIPAGGAPLPGSAAGAREVVGTWTRTLAFSDGFGGFNTSETTWTFAPTGAATRLVIARNLGAAVADTVTTRGTWTSSGNQLTFSFDPPLTGAVSYRYRIVPDTLYLDDLAFARR